MKNFDSVVSVPWVLRESPAFTIWVWETPHFRATIMGAKTSKAKKWEIIYFRGNEEKPLSDGIQNTFAAAERDVIEIITKSYNKDLGYRKYGGRIATTFEIFTKEKIDFGPLENKKVILKVRQLHPVTHSVIEKNHTGTLTINEYRIEMQPERGEAISIPPKRILEVYNAQTGKRINDESHLEHEKNLRIFKGKKVPGCNGMVGSILNTIEHSNPTWCPIHEKTKF